MSVLYASDALLGIEDVEACRRLVDASDGPGGRLSRALASIEPADLAWRGYDGPARALSRIIETMTPRRDPAGLSELRAVAIATLLLGLPERIRKYALPGKITACYPRALRTIVAHLQGAGTAYPSASDDAFVKDCRIVLGLSVPAGVLAADLHDRLRFRSLIKHAIVTRDRAPLVRLGRTALGARWVGIHADSRDLVDFHEPGWIACHLRIGALLRSRPTLMGVVGSSWFFDPQLLQVSPRLAYLQTIALRHGGIAIRNSVGRIHTELATARSESRRRMVEEGRYVPVCYTIAWPREALLAWCDAEEVRS